MIPRLMRIYSMVRTMARGASDKEKRGEESVEEYSLW